MTFLECTLYSSMSIVADDMMCKSTECRYSLNKDPSHSHPQNKYHENPLYMAWYLLQEFFASVSRQGLVALMEERLLHAAVLAHGGHGMCIYVTFSLFPQLISQAPKKKITTSYFDLSNSNKCSLSLNIAQLQWCIFLGPEYRASFGWAYDLWLNVIYLISWEFKMSVWVIFELLMTYGLLKI